MERGGRAGLQRAAGGGAGGGGGVTLEARLHGGAPWGFTVQGGREYEEPLIISKVEEGGKADRLDRPLQVGDEIIVINDVELSGYRQEAIALVKGSYRTLQLIVRRRSEPKSRPHSWHSTKLAEGQLEVEPGTMDTMSSAWQHSYQPSASTTDLSGGFDSCAYLRKSPDQYSSRGSMESLEPPLSSQHNSGAQHHPLGHHAHSGSHPTYSSCHQLSSARSSNSIDHLHSKRDSAYSSFSTSSSIPEYLASAPFSTERSYSLETVSQRGGGSGEMQQADLRYVRTVYDAQQGLSQEHELSSTSAALLRNSDSRGGEGARSLHRDPQVGGVCYRGSSSGNGSSSGVTASNRHSVGPIWGPAASCSSYESLKGAPAPPRRSDSYVAIRNHERPNSWSSLDHARSLRSLQKGSWHHSSGPVAPTAAKGSYGAEGQLHTVIEKSPESSPTTKPRQGGGLPQTPCPPRPSSSAPSCPSPQSGQLILPTGKYPVPQPEPHYAQMPSAGPGGVYPALAKESSRQQHQGGREEGLAEGRMETKLSKIENGYQNTASSSYSSPAAASTQFKTQAHEAARHQQEDPDLYTHPQKTARRGSEGQTREQRPLNHHGPHTHNFQGSHTSQEPYSQVLQEPDQSFYPHSQVTSGLRAPPAQERRGPCPPLQSTGDSSSSLDQTSLHSEPAPSSRLTQSPVHAQPQVPPTSASLNSHHLSDSAALPHHHWDHRDPDREREHPLTRLENALAEVQRCDSPDSVFSASSHGNSSVADGPAHTLSVLEKVSRFEHRERTGKQRSYSVANAHNKVTHLRVTEKGHSVACGADDLRNMLERSNKVHRTLSYRGGSSDHMKHRSPADPSLALQRSRSTFQLKESREADSPEDFPWRQDMQVLLGSMQDTSFNRKESSGSECSNRSYRDSLKDAQSKVLRSTSFKRRDLSSSISPPPPVAPAAHSSSSSQQPPPIPAKHHATEKKGPKTMPKPQGIVIAPQSPPPIMSPHTPKERHVVSPEIRGPSPPSLPSVPPVGPPALMRICGRKRLGADQKKRSYSEPENLNEVGVTDAGTTALFRRGGETSVADRRRMFELASRGSASGRALQNAPSRPNLRQLQHHALAEYVERKRGLRKDEGGPRVRSAHPQPENRSHTVSYCQSDTISLASTCSLLSLQDSDAGRSTSSGERRHSSALAPGADLQSLQSNLFYPGRVTTPRLPMQSEPSAPSSSPPELQTQILQDPVPEAGLSRDPDLGRLQLHAEPQVSPGLSKQLNGALQRVWSANGSAMSASDEDLLKRSRTQATPQHQRSHSSPAREILSQDIPPDDFSMLGVCISEPGRRSLAEDRPADIQASIVHLQPPQNGLSTVQPAGPSPDLGSSHTPVNRRERQRHVDRQRASSTSTLAASVGLPCPFSPSGAQDGGSEWHASERLSQANLDAITFPGIPHSGAEGGATGHDETPAGDFQTGHSLSYAGQSVDSARKQRAFSSEAGGHLPRFRPISPPAPPPPSQPSSQPSGHQRLSSLRISESSLFSPVDRRPPPGMGSSQEDVDEVFLQSPAPPTPPPPIQETSTIDDFPPPPPPIESEREAEQQTVESRTSLPSPPASPSSTVFPWPAPSLPPALRPQPSTITSITSTSAADSPGLEYQPVPEREKTCEEQRVEALARQLVFQDSSLAPLLDAWGNKSTVERMQDIFTNSKPVGKSPWQRRESSRVDDRAQDDVCDPAQSKRDGDLDEDEKNLDSKKVELCEALRCSVAALWREKEALCEEQRRHQALGASIETLVQERLKPNEREKYSMFIGDLERIVNLLLSLCSRLSRIDQSLLALEREKLRQEEMAEERDSLHHKRSQLLRQTDDARELKENLDRRQRAVHVILSGYLTATQLQDYRRFVSTKPSLLIRQRHLDNLIRQGEEQLTRLADGLPRELAEAHSWSRACPFSSSSPAPCFAPFAPLPPTSAIPHPTNSIRSTTVTSL